MEDSRRPKPKTLVQYDANNYYARLGISPLVSVKEIKSIVLKKQNEAKSKKRFQVGSQYGEAEDEFVELQNILKEIGSEERKEMYDRINPHNEILTVQLGRNELWTEKMVQINLVSSWLLENLGQHNFLPTSESIPLWVPKGVDAGLLKYLEKFTYKKSKEEGTMLSVKDLNIISGDEDHSG